MTSLARADKALSVMEKAARDMEAANRGGTLDRRTYTHVIDPTPCYSAGYQARVRLLVQAKYNEFSEKMAHFGSAEVASRYPRVHFEYVTHYETHTVPLKRQEAVSLLATGNLPFVLREKPPAPDDGWDVGRFLDQEKTYRGHGLKRGREQSTTVGGMPL